MSLSNLTLFVTLHSWCCDVPRDEAVRAAEDGRDGPLPTLEEAIAEPFAESRGQSDLERLRADADCLLRLFQGQANDFAEVLSVVGRIDARVGRMERMLPKIGSSTSAPEHENKGNDMAPNGLRTERVTLEVTYDLDAPLGEWIVQVLAPYLGFGESVRVVDEAHFDDLANVAMERASAIRERDKLRAEGISQALTADRFAAAVAEADTLRARVAELEEQLESVADRAAAAETALESAPAASVAAGTGWLTPTEQEAIMFLIANRSQFAPQTPHEERRNAASRVCHDLLARSMPPEAMIPKTVSASGAPEHEHKGDGMTPNGLRTEQVTLEVTHNCAFPLYEWS